MLLERAGEQAALREAFAAARIGLGGTIVLEGEAGIGKTALLAPLAEHAREQRATVLSARGAELEREFAFGVARQLFGIAPPENADEFAALDALFWRAYGATDNGVAVLIVDDAQWADAPSLRFLAFLARRLDGLPLLLVIARRTGEPALELDRVAAEPTTRILRPQALSVAAVVRLLGARFGDAPSAIGEACHRATGGNPFLLRALLDELERAPAGERLQRARTAGPEEVRRAMLLRLAALPRQARALAHAVAVAGDGVRPADAARLAGVADAAAAIDALVAERVLSAGDGLAFVHPVARHAIYADIPPAARAGLHRSAAAALDAAGAAPERIAAQWLAVPAGDALEALPPLRAAAVVAADRGAPDVAARYLRRALEETPGDPELLLAIGQHEALAGEPAAAAHLEAALERGRDPVLRTDAAIALVDVAVADGRDRANLLSTLADELEPTHPELAMRLDAELALTQLVHGGTPSRLVASLERVHTLTNDSLAARSLLAAASFDLVVRGGPNAEVAALAERSLAGDPVILLGTRALSLAPMALLWIDQLERALALVEGIVRDAQARGAVLPYRIGSTLRSIVQFRLGHVGEAEADARAALATEDEWPTRPWASAALIAALRERGGLEEATALLAEAGEPPPTMMTAGLLLERAHVKLARGDTRAALADFRVVGDVGERWGVRSPSMLPWRSGAALALGADDEAVALAEQELALARVPAAEAVARRTLALVGPPAERVAQLEAAVEVAAASPARLEHARTLVYLGAAHHRSGHRRAARRALAEGLDLAHRCQASVLEQHARELLTRTGARPRRAQLSGVDALTASEKRTVEMAANGLTNRDIARALFVTPKTVEAHLTRAYAKLGVRGRDELTAWSSTT